MQFTTYMGILGNSVLFEKQYYYRKIIKESKKNPKCVWVTIICLAGKITKKYNLPIEK